MTEAADRLQRVFAEILEEADNNAAFAHRLERALLADSNDDPVRSRAPNRRAPGVLDPFALWAEGEALLRDGLNKLTVDQLKDIVSEHGMDRSRLALKWRRPERLVELIIETVAARTKKGDVFRTDRTSDRPTPAPKETEPVLDQFITAEELDPDNPLYR